MSTKLFVGSLPWSVDDKTLQAKFEEHGTVVSAKVITDRTQADPEVLVLDR